MARYKSNRRAAPVRRQMLRMVPKNQAPLSSGLLLTLLVILGFGLVMLFSASYATGYYRMGDSYHYIRPQLFYALAGCAIMYVISFVDYHWLRKWVWPLYVVTFILLIVVLFMPPIHSHRRWINIKGLPTVQISEIAKFSLVLSVAHMMDAHKKKMGTFKYGVLMPVAVAMPFWIAILPETHYSAIVILGCMLITMMWAGGTRPVWFGLGILGMAGGVSVILLLGRSYVADRFSGWLDPFSDVLNTTRQTAQSLYAVGSGGVFGLGIGNSRQKHLWLPEPTNDFIFSILCEELGFVGAALCIALFAALIIQGFVVAMNAPDRFGALIGVGIVAQISWQVVFNIAVVTNTIPNTGVSLPFFSSGGTSVVILLAEMGVLLNISRAGNARKQAEAEEKAAAKEPLRVALPIRPQH